MASELLVFMPDGDMTLILTRTIRGKADHSSKTVEGSASRDSHSATEHALSDGDTTLHAGDEGEAATEDELDDDTLYYAPDPPGSEDGPLYPPTPRAARGSDASSRRERSASPPASFWAALKRQAARDSPFEEEEESVSLGIPQTPVDDIVVSSHDVHCLVSSRHMMLASYHFQTLLSGNSDAATALRKIGHVTVALSVDANAMIVLLNIIHGASRKVPRQVSLEELHTLAVLVSGFGMSETVEFFADTWIDNLKRDGLPKAYHADVLALVFVFWVFNATNEFRTMTKLMQHQCDEKLSELKLQIPVMQEIIDTIQKDRESAIESAVTIIHQMIDRYMVGRTLCDASLDDELKFACDAMVLGSLLKGSNKIEIWPRFDRPFCGRTFKELTKAIRSIKILDVCNKSSSRRWTSHGPANNSHGLESDIEESLKNIENGLAGLDMSDYTKKREDSVAAFEGFIIEIPDHKPKSIEDKKGINPDKPRDLDSRLEETTAPLYEKHALPVLAPELPVAKSRDQMPPIDPPTSRPTSREIPSHHDSAFPETRISRTAEFKAQPQTAVDQEVLRPSSREIHPKLLGHHVTEIQTPTRDPNHHENDNVPQEQRKSPRQRHRSIQQMQPRTALSENSHHVEEDNAVRRKVINAPRKPLSYEEEIPPTRMKSLNESLMSVEQPSPRKSRSQDERVSEVVTPKSSNDTIRRETVSQRRESTSDWKVSQKDTKKGAIDSSQELKLHPAFRQGAERDRSREGGVMTQRSLLNSGTRTTNRSVQRSDEPLAREKSSTPPRQHEPSQRPYPVSEDRLSTNLSSRAQEPQRTEDRATEREEPKQVQMQTQNTSYNTEYRKSGGWNARQPEEAPRKSPPKQDPNPSQNSTFHASPSPLSQNYTAPKVPMHLSPEGGSEGDITKRQYFPRDELKLYVKELQAAPTVASIEEVIKKEALPTGKDQERIVGEVGGDTKDSGEDEEDSWMAPRNFKVRRPKKTISTRY